MSVVTGYTICFVCRGTVKHLTFASPDEAEIERRIEARYGPIEIISRTPLGPRGLEVLRLKRGDWLEWTQFARKQSPGAA